MSGGSDPQRAGEARSCNSAAGFAAAGVVSPGEMSLQV